MEGLSEIGSQQEFRQEQNGPDGNLNTILWNPLESTDVSQDFFEFLPQNLVLIN